MELVLQTQTVKLVESKDLDTFITQAYGLQKRYEIVPTEELTHGSYTLFSVAAEPLDEYDQKQLETLRAKGYCGNVTHIVLKDLCNKGWLEPGEYLVSCSW